jgi:TRAP-type C4-dicarboxylate transport system substrate-binding protein
MKSLMTPVRTSVLAFALALPAIAHAQTHMATNWLAPAHILNEHTYQRFSADVAKATNGAVKFEVHSSGSLVPARDTMRGIRDGVAVIGIVYPPYTPADFPLSNVVNDLVFAADDDMAASFAFTEMSMTHPKLVAEWKKNGGIFAGGYSTPVYNFVCIKPVRSLNDAKGLKIRTAGGAQTEWVKLLGAVPVSVPIGDVYSGLERGSLDCTLTDPTNLDKGNKFWEVAKSVTLLPMGVVLGANYVVNPDFWKKQTVGNRKILLENMALGNARAQVAYHVGVQAAIDGSRKRGLEIIQPGADIKVKLEEFNKAFISSMAKQAMESRKVADPSDLIAAYIELQRKWKGLMQGVDRTSEQAVFKVVNDNLYSKLDPTKFGL